MNTLSGRFLILTILFVMLAEVLVFVPSVARHRENYLLVRLEKAQVATMALLVSDDIGEKMEREILADVDVYNVVLRRHDRKELILSSPIPEPAAFIFDLRDPGEWELMVCAMRRLFRPRNDIIRVIGHPARGAGEFIEIAMETAPLRASMLEYGLRVLAFSAIISAISAALLFLAVRSLLVKPIKRVVDSMVSYASAPEDARRIIRPSASAAELREAENALASLQTRLFASLRQKEHLAQLGGAVAKISHDLRNILTTVQLFADRIDMGEDRGARRAAPKLMGAIGRAMTLCERTLAYGKAEEPPPTLDKVLLVEIIDDVLDGERLACTGKSVSFVVEAHADMSVRADPEQLYRVLSNLVQNARQAIVATGASGEIVIRAVEDDKRWTIRVSDDGPGLPEETRERLFDAFHPGGRKGGFGLGLSIAAELVRGHGGNLNLAATGPEGTTFEIHLPKCVEALEFDREPLAG